MKVAGCVIQNKNISENTEDVFCATYKGKRFYITQTDFYGQPKYDHLKRFLIDVVDIETGMYDVQSYEDFHSIHDAIIYALKGSQLIK